MAEPRFKKLLGNGRSAVVYRLKEGGRDVARKVFTGSTAAAIAQLIFYGAPLDYRWNRNAVEAALYRRKVLRILLKYWFGDTLTIADAYGVGRDDEEQAYYLDTEFIGGHLARHYSPFLSRQRTEIYHLRDEIMPQLQGHLKEAGLIGTVWQAGYGQPCAFPNFLCIHHGEEKHGHRWVWIDAESGVPAIVSYNPVPLFGFYLPWALRKRRVLFDDLHEPAFTQWLENHMESIREKLGDTDADALKTYSEKLIEAHRIWGQENRTSRATKYYAFRGTITEQQSIFYQGHKIRWVLFQLRYLSRKVPEKIREKVREYIPFLREKLHPIRWFRLAICGLFSTQYRLELSEKYIQRGIEHWHRLHRLNDEERSELEDELSRGGENLWLADFGVHLGIKPLGYLLRFTLVPLLIHFRVVSPEIGSLLFIFMGNLLRTGYTLMRCLQCLVLRKPMPLTALLISPVPTFGTIAFPCQMLHAARRGSLLSQLIIYETCSASASAIPIWGGRDNGWDHKANQIAHRIIIWAT